MQEFFQKNKTHLDKKAKKIYNKEKLANKTCIQRDSAAVFDVIEQKTPKSSERKGVGRQPIIGATA